MPKFVSHFPLKLREKWSWNEFFSISESFLDDLSLDIWCDTFFSTFLFSSEKIFLPLCGSKLVYVPLRMSTLGKWSRISIKLNNFRDTIISVQIYFYLSHCNYSYQFTMKEIQLSSLETALISKNYSYWVQSHA